MNFLCMLVITLFVVMSIVNEPMRTQLVSWYYTVKDAIVRALTKNDSPKT